MVLDSLGFQRLQRVLAVEHQENLFVACDQLQQRRKRGFFFDNAQRVDHKDHHVGAIQLLARHLLVGLRCVDTRRIEDLEVAPAVALDLVGFRRIGNLRLLGAEQRIDQRAFARVVYAVNHDGRRSAGLPSRHHLADGRCSRGVVHGTQLVHVIVERQDVGHWGLLSHGCGVSTRESSLSFKRVISVTSTSQ